MGNEALVLKPSLWDTLRRKFDVNVFIITVVVLACLSGLIWYTHIQYEKDYEEANHVPDITIPSMDLTVLNVTETRLSVKSDIMIRIPPPLPGYYMCLKGDVHVFMLYKGVTIGNSSIGSYDLIPYWAQLLKVSLIASEGDMDGVIVKDIMEDIKQGGEIRFRSRLILPDCRDGTNGKMNYACDEAKLRFEPGSQRKATLFGNNPTCLCLH